MLERVLGEQPDGLERVTDLLQRGIAAAPWAGRAVFGGLLSLGYPRHPLGDLWRAADLLREHRGDSHVLSWTVGGADAVEILLLTEQWWGLPARAYTPTRGWTAADIDAGFQRLQHRGLMTVDEHITNAGRAFREEVEVRTTNWKGLSSTRSATTSTSSSSISTPGQMRSLPLAPTRREWPVSTTSAAVPTSAPDSPSTPPPTC